MAAEMPVKDVLCEAMEYLSKLGANLRTRSENLKEKKIRRDKLTNALAVQKAADKVLLICELSKKSLANVEAGVRKVLEHIDVSQEASSIVGGKSSSNTTGKRRDYKPNYHYFEYKSRKLKIKTKISLKHYKSVKVLARKMSTSMLDKYPVYHDCKLYRMRKRKGQAKKEEENSERETESGMQDENDVTVTVPSKHQSTSAEILENDSDSLTLTSEIRRSTEINSRRSSKSDKMKSPKNTRDTYMDSDDQGHTKHLGKHDEDNSETEKQNTVKSNENKPSGSDDHETSKCHEPEKKRRKISKTENLQQNNNDDVISLDSENENRNPSVCKTGKDDSESDSHEKSEIQNNDDSKKPIIKCVSLSKLLKPDVIKKDLIKSPDPKSSKKLSGKKFDIIKKNKMLATAKKNKDDFWTQKRKEVGEFKPKIFTINVTRLPDFSTDFLLENNIKKITKEGETIYDITESIPDSTVEQTISNKDYINNSNQNSKELNNDSDDAQIIAEANKVKNSLLNESDSDDNNTISKYKEKESETNVKRIKNALLNSDSDQNEDNANSTSEPEKTKGKDNNSDNDEEKILDKLSESGDKNGGKKNKQKSSYDQRKTDVNSEVAKNDLLDKSDSDSEGEKTDKRHKKLKIDSENESEKPDKSDKDSENEKSDSSHKNYSGNKSEKPDKSDKDSENEKSDSSHKNYSGNKSEKSDISVKDSENEKSDSSHKKYSGNESEKSDKSDKDSENEKSDSNHKKYSGNESEKSDKSHKDSEKESVKSNKSCKSGDEKDKNTSEDESTESLRNQKTPEKEFVPDKDDNAKKSLLNDFSNDETEAPLDQRKAATPQSNKKRIRESVHAKNALLRYSSGSETEDEQLRNTLNEIKKSLLEGMSDDENKINAKDLGKQRRSSQGSSSSDEDMLKIVRKKQSHDSNSSSLKKKHTKRKKLCIKSSSEEENKKSSSSNDDISRSSSSKMVRSKGKPGNSSSHSSDAQDPNDKDIDGLTNLHTLNASRRRNSDAADRTESSNSSTTRSRMAKQTGLIGEDILKAESSSDAVSNDEDDGVEEDLPSVTLPGFNGGLEHLVKEDLLVESDSSVSNKEEEASNKDDSDDERLKAKRRKAHAIASSDSETGTVRKKDKDEDIRLTDFEDSDDSEVTKRSKRKKKGSDSDGSGGSSDAGKKKRRRIKSVNDSDASGSDSENDGKNKHGRKNIRKVMGKDQLEEATKKAAREEKERVARIAERQKMYNNLQFDESGKPDEVVLDRVELDFDPETKEPLIAVDRGLVKKLKPHQANGIKFMWDACFESVKRIKKAKGSGCILAHCMGLGKTLQVVALTHTLLAHDSLTKVHRVLVVCPLSTVLNWVNEFKMWLKHAEQDSDIDVYELSRFKQNGERAFQLSQWFEHGGVCVLGYEMFRNLSADNNKKFKKKMLKNFQEALVDPGPDLVVCDEGHLLKNEKTSLSQSMNKVRTLRRIVLTGTPLQNNLKEYYCMVQFVKPNLLGKYNEYLNRFVNPITNGQYTDSTEHDIKIMKRRSHVLHKMLDGAVQRRDYGVLAPFLPPKHEYVLFITLSAVQTKLYQFYLDNYSRRPLPGKSSGFLFPDFQSLQRIWTHPLVLKYNSERYEIMQQKKRDKEEEDSEGSLVDFIDDDSTPAESTSDDSSDDSSDLSDDSRKKSKKKKGKKSKGKDKDKDKDKDKESAAASRRRGTRANPIDLDLEEQKDDDILEVKNENPTEWWIKMVEDEELDDMRNSHKLVLLFDILRQCETIGDKLLVFSQSLYSLDLIEHFLGKVDEATQEGRIDEKLGSHVGSWSPGIDYFRLDGSTSCENRSIWCKNFNREDNPRARLFLISTRAGGLGINLVAANRVVIFDVSWNPSHDVQSIFRVYRFGQKKPCYVYRFLAMGTMEEKIYERQVTKQAISKRVIDEQQIDRHYAENDLAELYKFEAEPPSPRPLPPLPKDRLFAEMLREHEAQIYKYHEHDSLLENKEEETLSEEERKAAWEDFENEKNRPPPAPFPSPWPMNGMMPNLLAQQQQQLAYAAIVAMLRKDMPNVNDNQIRDMLPMIYNANPALMQKMSEIYKYSQQMNMNPGMMGQASMNPASGGMAGMGSTSGLQYEPPWQRQQQQQQQMRLQQLMQQQQNMGAAAKFYAGGLGSRDPVAMALQQQRAREIMVGGGAGRPRGRPPMQPRAPPATSGDVVNLDSD